MQINGPETIAALSVDAISPTRLTEQTHFSYVGFSVTPTDGKIYFGGPNVTASTGEPLEIGQTLFIATRTPDAWYLIADTGSVDVRANLYTGTR